ncbi:MAG: TIGR02646 family protein [Bacteroides sp.]|nr:TIGR02646 family protein [Bacteroides sp.]
MKHIIKHPEPQEFIHWKTRFPAATYADLRQEQQFSGATKALLTLRDSLASEQGYLCCYCESLIDNGNFHIEHFRPKCVGKFPHLQLTYNNLLACCHKTPIGGTDECCGHKKSNIFDNDLISPLSSDCESHFQYNMAGKVLSTDGSGKKTITLLNLNSTLLIRKRKDLIEYFEDLEEEEYDKEVIKHLNSSNCPLGEFYTTIKYLHNQRLLH